MKTVALSDIVKRTSTATGFLKSEVKFIIDEFLYEVVEELGRGNSVHLECLGKFDIREPKLDPLRTEPYKRKPTKYVDFRLAATAKKKLREAGWIIPRDG